MLNNVEIKESLILKDRLIELKFKCSNSQSLAEEIYYTEKINETLSQLYDFYLKRNMKSEAEKYNTKFCI